MQLQQFSLNNREILVTGGCGLLGQEHADAIAKAGGIPILLDKNLKERENIKKYHMENYNYDIPIIECDITKEESILNASRLIKGPIHGIINNAALNPSVSEGGKLIESDHLEKYSVDRWNLELAVSLTGSMLVLKYFGPLLKENQGSIINVSSDLGIIGPDQRIYNEGMEIFENVKPLGYSVTKSGLIGMTRYVATYWAHKGIRCNAICPGGIENGQDKEFISRLTKLIPLGRMARKNEYQGIIIFLLSEASSYMNGSIISIDGGRSAW